MRCVLGIVMQIIPQRTSPKQTNKQTTSKQTNKRNLLECTRVEARQRWPEASLFQQLCSLQHSWVLPRPAPEYVLRSCQNPLICFGGMGSESSSSKYHNPPGGNMGLGRVSRSLTMMCHLPDHFPDFSHIREESILRSDRAMPSRRHKVYIQIIVKVKDSTRPIVLRVR